MSAANGNSEERAEGLRDAPCSVLLSLSLGAGVQSSCLALMAEKGETEKPNFAVFADTGDESEATYQWLDWLESQLS